MTQLIQLVTGELVPRISGSVDHRVQHSFVNRMEDLVSLTMPCRKGYVLLR
jgi:hypothetical protein